MALMNYSLPFGGIGPTSNNWASISTGLQTPHANAVNGLLYDPAAHQEEQVPYGSSYYRNNPYAPPSLPPRQQQVPQQQQPQQQNTYRGNNYLPPHQEHPTVSHRQQPQQQPQQLPATKRDYTYTSQTAPQIPTTRTYGESSYTVGRGEVKTKTTVASSGSQSQYFGEYSRNSQPASFSTRPATRPTQPVGRSSVRSRGPTGPAQNQKMSVEQGKQGDGQLPERPSGYVQVQSGQGQKTQTVAVVDYDDDEVEDGEEDDEYYDTGDGTNSPDGVNRRVPNVTPIQGPIFLGQNGTVPVVPLVQNPALTNSSFVQIPIWWTALSVALGLNVRGDVIRGAPCIKRNHQLFCPQAGSQYPKDKIEAFIDDNKALMKRMYGDFSMNEDYGSVLSQSKKRKRNVKFGDVFEPDYAAEMYGPPGSGPDPIRDAGPSGDSYFSRMRSKRQSSSRPGPRTRNGRVDNTGRVDACESKVEIVTPYWASNSAGKIRAIVNTQHFEQAIHQEVCTNVQTSRCAGDCGCEQKYKWHRLLAYDPDNDCKGIFMDWFLFPSCCVCRCNPLGTN